jgi:hypothetical protein
MDGCILAVRSRTADRRVMRVVILLGLLIGMLIGSVACARYLRQEIAANIGPRLRIIEQQLDSLHAEVTLATEVRLTELNKRLDQGQQEK